MGGHLGKNVVIAISLLAAGFLAAWLRFRPHLGTEGAFTDGRDTIEIERIERLRYAVWDSPEPMAGGINSGEDERAPAISPDGRYVVFVVGERGLGTDLWQCDLDTGGRATNPRPISGVNSASDDLAPAFAADGALLFATNRPGGKGGLDLWRAPYDRGVFDAAEPLEGSINSGADETDPASVPGTGDIAFASNRQLDESRRGRRDYDVYVGTPFFVPGAEDGARVTEWNVRPIEEVNSPFDERDPCLSADGRALLFASDRMRSGGSEDFDLYRASRAPIDPQADEPGPDWLPPQPLEGVNSPASERHPRPTADGFALLFTRGASPGVEPAEGASWDVWTASSRELVRTPGKPIGWRELLVLTGLLLLALLAALAKRWRGLDIIYKAFLISLLIHLALLYFSREVVPKGAPVESHEGDENRVLVRLVEDPDSLSARRNEERGGAVEAKRQTVKAAADVEASEALREALQAEAREVESRPDEAEALERSEVALAAAPAKAEVGEAERQAEMRRAEAELRTAESEFARLTGAAPELTVEAERSERARSAREQADAQLAAEALRAQENSASEPAAAPASAAELARAENAPTGAAPARREVRVDRSEVAASAESSPDIASPNEAFERKVADSRAASKPLDVLASDEASVPGRRTAETSDATAAAPQGSNAEIASAVAPSATSLERSSRSALATAPAPQRASGATEPSKPREGAAKTVDVADAGTSDGPRLTADAPEFDAVGSASPEATDLRRSSAERGEVTAAAPSASGAPIDETPTELAPAASARLGRAERAAPTDAPRFTPSLAAGALEPNRPERKTTPKIARPIDLAKPEGDEAAPVVAEGPERERGAELAPTDLPAPLTRSRGGSATGAPGLAAAQGPADEAPIDAPKPLERDLGTPSAPKPLASLPAPKPRRDDWDRTPYQSRSGERKIAALEEFGGTAETEAAVELGLSYLAKRQRSDGRWGRRQAIDKYGQTMIGKTGLAMLAFMGAGHTATSKSLYSANVARAQMFLLENQDPRSGHIGDTSSYGHAIATYALGEAYALTNDPTLREPLEDAVAHILRHQIRSSDPLFDGGWSYFYSDARTVDEWPRASVTAWQVMALESGKLGGIDVPRDAFTRARSFLVNTWDPRRGAFRYSHDPNRLRSDYPLLPGSTPATMFALSLLGVDITDSQFAPARRFVLERAPNGYRFTGEDDFVFKAQANLYFWYYGTLAMFRAGDDAWRRWNVAMKDSLVPAQEPDGSWRPISIYADYAQDTDADRIYTTAMNVLALEIYYRYFTPLLEVE